MTPGYTVVTNFQFATVEAPAHTVRRTPRGISRRRSGAFFANLVRTGTARVTQFGVTARALAGDIVLLDTDSPFDFALEGVCDVACLTIPEASLRTRLGRTGRPDSPVVVSRSGAGRLASAYLRACVELERTELAQVADIAFDQVWALIAIADHGDPRDASTRGRAVTLAAVLALIERHLDDPTLSSASAARELGCSRSLLSSLLAEAGLTFAGYIRTRRLAEIARAIVASDAPLGEVALAWDYDEPSSFAREFRAHYGVSPTNYRGARRAMQRQSFWMQRDPDVSAVTTRVCEEISSGSTSGASGGTTCSPLYLDGFPSVR